VLHNEPSTSAQSGQWRRTRSSPHGALMAFEKVSDDGVRTGTLLESRPSEQVAPNQPREIVMPPAKKAIPAAKKAAAPAKAAPAKVAIQATVTLKHLAAELADSHDLPIKQAEAMLGDLVALTTRHLKRGDKTD
jgi:hypothetical protein